jgi:hypothetical protein
MRSKGKVVSWGVALVAAAALTTTIAAHPGFGSPKETEAAPNATAVILSSEQMSAVMVPLSQQPASRDVVTMTVKDAANAFPLPSGQVYEPEACLSYVYDVVGSFSAANGWITFGTRATTGKKFMQFVVNIPKGVDVRAIEASAARCTTGTVTLQDKVKGEISLTTGTAPQAAGVSTLSITTRMQFHEAPGSEGAAILAQNLSEMYSEPNFANQSSTTFSNFGSDGSTLIAVQESDQATADLVARGMAQNLNTVMGR